MNQCPTQPDFPATMWSHINGWEVVTAVAVIATCWAAVSILRFYFMVELSKLGSRRRKD